jgi:hypothetical protein
VLLYIFLPKKSNDPKNTVVTVFPFRPLTSRWTRMMQSIFRFGWDLGFFFLQVHFEIGF